VFCTFLLQNLLRATTACNFSSLISPDVSAPAALASLLFDPPEPQIIGKTQCFATFSVSRRSCLSRTCIFFLLIFSLLTLLTSAFHLSILSEVSLLNFLRLNITIFLNSINNIHQLSNSWMRSLLSGFLVLLVVFECLSHHAKQQYVDKEIASVPPSEGLVQTQWELCRVRLVLESHRPFSEDNRQGFFSTTAHCQDAGEELYAWMCTCGRINKKNAFTCAICETTGPPEGARRGALAQEVLQGKGKARKGKGKNVEGKGKVGDAAAETALTLPFSTQRKGGQDVQPAMAWPSLDTTGYDSLLQFAT